MWRRRGSQGLCNDTYLGEDAMSYTDQNPYAMTYGPSTFAAAASESERTTFIRRTYAHLAGAVFAFMAIELVIFNMVPAQRLHGPDAGG